MGPELILRSLPAHGLPYRSDHRAGQQRRAAGRQKAGPRIPVNAYSHKTLSISIVKRLRLFPKKKPHSNRCEPAGTTRDEIIHAKKLFASAFHPDTGELQNFVGRMSFQLPGGCIITGGMLTFYRSMPAVVLWQWINQSFNALVNYTNRNANSELTVNQLAGAYVMATGSALVAAIYCKRRWQRTAGPTMQRYVPFAAVAAANCINIPLMRQQELLKGVDVYDEHGNVVGTSRVAAAKGIGQVVFSRIVMASPGMVLLPYITSQLEARSSLFKRLPWAPGPFQLVMNGLL